MNTSRNLQIKQLDQKMSAFARISEFSSKGWISTVRITLGMSYRQMAKRLKITPQSVQGFEKREMEGNISLKNLGEVARSMNMRLVYGLVPASGSLEKMITDQALAVATKIVMRTDTTMKLEDQGITKERRDKAILELADEIKREMPRVSMGLDFKLVKGQTPLDENEVEGLLIPTITTRGELDEFEQLNIQEAIQWMLSRNFKREEILTENFIRQVHKKMYGNVWRWAGEFRKANKNIGVDRFQVPTELRALIEDCNYWIDHNTYTHDEIAVRFKHRIVFIHCFPNGNGRHSRMMGDLIVERILGREVFSWGSKGDLITGGEAREKYIRAIKAADNSNLTPLLEFSRA